jgi:hypothetical protein
MANWLTEIGSVGKGGPEVPEKIVTGDDYRNSLHDGRRVYYDGSVVEDLATHPRFASAVDVTAASYDRAAGGQDGPRGPEREQDIAGGSLINAPLPGDLESEEIGTLVKKYMRGTDWADGEYRTRLLYGAGHRGRYLRRPLAGRRPARVRGTVRAAAGCPQGLRHGRCQAAGAGCHRAAGPGL